MRRSARVEAVSADEAAATVEAVESGAVVPATCPPQAEAVAVAAHAVVAEEAGRPGPDVVPWMRLQRLNL